MILTETPNDWNTWKGFVIALICLAPFIMVLLSFEFAMYLIQVKNTYFKKQKWFEKGLIVDIVVIVLCSTVAIIATVFSSKWTYNSYAIEGLSYTAMALWWFVVLLSFAFILSRILATKHINAKYKLDPKDLLTQPVSKIAAFTGVKDYKEVIANSGLKSTRWKSLIDGDYGVLNSMIKTFTNEVTKDQVAKLVADCVVFHERYVVSTSAKKRNYATALFLNLIEELQPAYNVAK